MRAVSRVSHWIATAGLVAASVLIGWVARSTSADNIRRQAVILPAIQAVNQTLELAQAPAEPAAPQPTPVQAGPPTPATSPDVLVPVPTPFGVTVTEPAGAQDPSARGPELQPLTTPPVGFNSAPRPEAIVSPALPTPTDNDDPAKAVQTFVEQNQKVAETQLKNLRDEEAKLRARLEKVEAGIKRWEALVEALKMSKDGNAVVGKYKILPPRSAADSREDLAPIPKAKFVPVPR